MLWASHLSHVKAASWSSLQNSAFCKQIASIGQVPSPSLLLFPCKDQLLQEFQSMNAALWPVGLSIFVKSVRGLFYHCFQSDPHLGCAISLGQFSSKSQQSFCERVQMLTCEKTCRFEVYFSLTALIHLYKGFSLKKWPKPLELKDMLVICHSIQGT